MTRLGFLKTHSYAVRRVMGIVIIAAAGLIYAGVDVQLLAASGGEPTNITVASPSADDGKIVSGLEHPYPAPEITGINDWINAQPLKIADLKGKVVLIDFWTYSCINCVRTLPYITSWNAKYRDKGLVIIGVHAPEFGFEKKLENVRNATEKFGITYPVALDNNLITWGNFQNKYWPAHYLIDHNGNVVYTHFGEGHYTETEHNIRALLGIAGDAGVDNLTVGSPTTTAQTQETYLGYARAKNFAHDGAIVRDASATYNFPKEVPQNMWALDGDWAIAPENITSRKAEASLRLNFTARKVFLVLGTRDGNPIDVHIALNGVPAGKFGGADVDKNTSMLKVDHEMLYELIDQSQSANGLLEIKADQPGLQAYAFTFGG